MPKDLQIPSTKNVTFEVLRYQLVVDKTMQADAFKNYSSPEQLRADKNNIFRDVITNQNFRFNSSSTNIKSKLLYQKGDMYYFKISTRRKARIYKEDFTEDTIDNFPNIIVAVNNDPNVQKIAIQSSTNPFKDVETVRRFIVESLDAKMKTHSLSFYLEPIFDKQDFWHFVRKYPNQITQLNFNFISPNLANISKGLSIDLKQGYEETNMHKAKFEMNAEKGSVLKIDEEGKFVNGLVSYIADGGGTDGGITAKILGKRDLLNTAQNPSEFTIDDKFIKDNNWEELDNLFKDILL
jgi:hypothetical protein